MEELFQFLATIIPDNMLVIYVGAVFVRLSVFFMMLPGLGETSVPVRIRLMVSLVTTWIVTPVVLQQVEMTPLTAAGMAFLFAQEALTGFVLGFGLRVTIYVLQITGTIIAQALSLSQIFGSTLTEEPNTMVSSLLMMAGMTLALTMGLHIEAIRIFLWSFTAFPLGQTGELENIAWWATQKSMAAFAFALSLSLPFVLLNFLYNLMLGLINRAMPQLMVSFVGLPAITGVGLVLLAAAVGALLTVWVASYAGLTAEFPAGP